MLEIKEIAKKIGINDIEYYGKYKGKIDYTKYKNKKGRLILITSINPTPFGEGKTTLSIGINDALRKLGYNSIATLREPSMGPVFGIKGGATGGGMATIVPEEDINLHFTGDMHAITACNNLLCALIDNHIFHGNELNINPESICFHRCLDVNDRILRNIKLENRNEKFSITAASEIMAILCLSKDIDDLKKKLENILIGYTYDNSPIFVKNLGCVNSLILILKDAIKPNLVQSIEENPIIIHGGPFANIAHGCSSLISTNLALSLSDYVITEAGFGSDLGAEKFFDIKCRYNLNPSLTIINFTIKSLKYNGGCPKEDVLKENINYLDKGINNLKTHIDNMLLFNDNVLVVLNKFDSDTDNEINYLKSYLKNIGMELFISTAYKDGSNGCIEIANKIVEVCEYNNNFRFLYNLNDSIENKINTICKKIYRFDEVIINNEIKDKINQINNIGFSNLPICISKSQYVNKKNICEIKNIELKSGAGFIIVYLDNAIDMPGLPKTPNALKI